MSGRWWQGEEVEIEYVDSPLPFSGSDKRRHMSKGARAMVVVAG